MFLSYSHVPPESDTFTTSSMQWIDTTVPLNTCEVSVTDGMNNSTDEQMTQILRPKHKKGFLSVGNSARVMTIVHFIDEVIHEMDSLRKVDVDELCSTARKHLQNLAFFRWHPRRHDARPTLNSYAFQSQFHCYTARTSQPPKYETIRDNPNALMTSRPEASLDWTLLVDPSFSPFLASFAVLKKYIQYSEKLR